MPRKASSRVSFSPDITEKPIFFISPKTRNNASHNQKRNSGSFTYGLCRNVVYSPVRLFKRIGTNMVRALRLISRRNPSAKVASKSIISRAFAPSYDSHQTEAIEDCIEFINTSYKKPC